MTVDESEEEDDEDAIRGLAVRALMDESDEDEDEEDEDEMVMDREGQVADASIGGKLTRELLDGEDDDEDDEEEEDPLEVAPQSRAQEAAIQVQRGPALATENRQGDRAQAPLSSKIIIGPDFRLRRTLADGGPQS